MIEDTAPKPSDTSIATDGGPYVAGNLHVAGNFIGRDAYYGYTAEQVRLLIAEIHSEEPPKIWDGRIPFMGLASFREADAHFFFGRERMVDTILERLGRARFLCVSGPSGSGKSSLIRAGLFHALNQGRLNGGDKWAIADLTPRHAPLEQLAQAMARIAKNPAAAEYLQNHASSDPLALHKQAETLLNPDQRQRLVVFVDQFEELFTQTKKEVERDLFIAQLINAAAVLEGRVTVLLSLRADFVAQCAAYPDLREAMSSEFQLVGAMTPVELARAVALPVLEVGARIQPELVAQIVQDMKGEPGALPLVQFALSDLFTATATQKGSEVSMTLARYLERGGVDQALERHADAVLARLDESQRQVARTVFTRVVEIGSGRADTRRVASYDELTSGEVEAFKVETVVQLLANEQARLLTTGEKMHTIQKEQDATTAATNGRTVTIAHERLIDAWPWLRNLIDQNRKIIAAQNQIEEDAQKWHQNEHKESYLYTDARLATVEEHVQSGSLDLTGRAKAFVDASTGRRKAATRRRVSIITTVTSILFIALFISLHQLNRTQIALNAEATAVAQAQNELLRAEWQTRRAQASELASHAYVELAKPPNELNPTRALLIALEAMQTTWWVDGYIHETASRMLVNALDASPPWEATFMHDNVVNSANFSPDAKYILTASEDGTAKVWSVHNRTLLFTLPHEDRVQSAAYSSDGKLIITTSIGSVAHLWDATNGRLLRTFGHGDWVHSAVFSSTGARILTVSDENNPQIWNTQSGTLLTTVGVNTPVRSAAFSPNDEQILTVNRDNTAQIWTVETQKLLFTLHHDKYISSATFSLDGQYVLTTSWDDTSRLWDAATGMLLLTIQHDAWVTTGGFSPDGQRIVTASNDGVVQITEVSTGNVLASLHHEDPVNTVTFSPDGETIVTSSGFWLQERGSAWLWDSHTGELIKALYHDSEVNTATFSPEGKYVLTAGYDSSIRLWNPNKNPPFVTITKRPFDSAILDPQEEYILTSGANYSPQVWDRTTMNLIFEIQSSDIVVASIFLPDNNSLLVARYSSVRIYDLTTGKIVVEFDEEETTYSAILSPTAEHVATVSGKWMDSNIIKIWNSKNGELLLSLPQDEDIEEIAFTPNGKSIVAAGADGTVKLWDIGTGTLLLTLDHSQSVTSVAVSPDGNFILSTNLVILDDSTQFGARLWDTKSGAHLFDLASTQILSAQFSPTGKYILTTAYGGAVHIWDIKSGELLKSFSDSYWLAQAVLSPDEKYLLILSENSARMWEVETSKFVASFPHADIVTSAVFSFDGTEVLTASFDGTARIWPSNPEEMLTLATSLIPRVPPQLTEVERRRYGLHIDSYEGYAR